MSRNPQSIYPDIDIIAQYYTLVILYSFGSSLPFSPPFSLSQNVFYIIEYDYQFFHLVETLWNDEEKITKKDHLESTLRYELIAWK